VGVFCADPVEKVRAADVVNERIGRVGATQGEGVLLGELVPKLFKADGSVKVFLIAEESDTVILDGGWSRLVGGPE
jgi:hypothetical protein